ncbi:MAG: hypothetical protein K2G39_02070, partial [Lachnospiraceae bacterium]|nr:hypothetical protein [Lachnospiraceae bacterium]
MMEFSEELLSNRIFDLSEMNFDFTPRKRKAEGCSFDPDVDKSYVLQPNGDYILKFYAPDAKEIKVVLWFGDPTPEGYAPWRDTPLHAVKDEEGVHTVVLPFDERKTGPRNLDIFVDGTYFVWHYLTVLWSGGKVWNYVEVPDNDMKFSYIYDVPHGTVAHEYYYSGETKRYERCLVYTPPGYEKGTQSYPVLYLQHGGTENETVWVSCGRVNFIMDNLLAKGECVPFIIVMNNGMIRYEALEAPNYVDECFENSLIHYCIPFIESKYRVKADKWNRAIAGLSMGSMQTNDIAFKHPDIFGNMGSFTSTMYHTDFFTTYERPWPRVMANPEQFMKDYKVFFCSATPQEDHIPLFNKDAEIMREAGIEGKMPGYRRVLHDGRFIRWDSWRMGLRE